MFKSRIELVERDPAGSLHEIKNEDDALKEIAGFVEKAGNIINEIKSKNVAEGYLDIIRELKGLKLDMIQDS